MNTPSHTPADPQKSLEWNDAAFDEAEALQISLLDNRRRTAHDETQQVMTENSVEPVQGKIVEGDREYTVDPDATADRQHARQPFVAPLSEEEANAREVADDEWAALNS